MNQEKLIIKLLHQILSNQVIVLKGQFPTSGDSCIETSQALITKTNSLNPESPRTPTNIEFTKVIKGVQSLGICNGEHSLLMSLKEDGWRVYKAVGKGLTGLRLMTTGSDIKPGEVIYASMDPHPAFDDLTSYYLCIGPSEYVTWQPHGGVKVLSLLGNQYIWRVEV